MAGREELLAEVSGFLEWCEGLDKQLFEVAHDVVKRQLRSKLRVPVVKEVGASGLPVTFISALDKAVAPVARHFAELSDDTRSAGRTQLAATVAAQAIRQRGRLSVGSYLVLTEPFRVAGFDFEDGWGVGPDAEGVATVAGAGGVEREVTDEGDG
ncbi:hypothetical protein GCM10027055_00020 [Janibacter alkaliphilus]|uniref:Uncharacterized protein n=1 Tax=Janibacter alkaliphilus TaxID=1069963 RepID=A0A852WZZ3_9MICO|nr:hypothetical protein [Janibacter alkaliphilus]NYG36622.1 hypothetical protein [Janibacter alkaliphilus]